MRKDITIAAEPRQARGKNEARRLRATAMIPAVVYGSGKDPVAVSVSPKEVNKILNSASGHNTIFNVDVTGQENTPVMVVDQQNHPVKGSLLHVDLMRIDLAKRITVKIPVHTVGDPAGVKLQGGVFEVVTREVEIECLPDEIPESFNVDVAGLMVGQAVRISDLPVSGTLKILSDGDVLIAHVVSIRGTEETEGAATTAEPEVIKKGKKEEAGGDAKKK